MCTAECRDALLAFRSARCYDHLSQSQRLQPRTDAPLHPHASNAHTLTALQGIWYGLYPASGIELVRNCSALPFLREDIKRTGHCSHAQQKIEERTLLTCTAQEGARGLPCRGAFRRGRSRMPRDAHSLNTSPGVHGIQVCSHARAHGRAIHLECI
jgi:hypothetical protein